MNLAPEKKPPLGIKPRKFHNEERLEEITGAIHRYIEVQADIPWEWLEEFLYLLYSKKIEGDKDKQPVRWMTP